MNEGARSGLLALAGGYVLYLAWEMFCDLRDGKTDIAPTLNICFIAFFTLAGLAVVIYAARVWNRSRKAERDGREPEDTKRLK